MSILPPNFLPRSLGAFRAYDKKTFFSDLVAGVTVGLVALPLAMAFAIASGVPPQSGIYCAIVAGFLISALGGSKTQIGGPTGAFVIVVSGIVSTFGIDGLLMCTMMAGVMLMVLGLSGLGTTVKYVPRPVVIGFTNGIAVLIASTQIKDFFGLSIEHVPGDFLGRMQAVVANFGTFSWSATIVSTLSLSLIILLIRRSSKVPGTIVALILGTVAVTILQLPVETIASRFGGIPHGLPSLEFPTFRPDLILSLLSPAVTITMLGAIESLLSAVVADRMSGDKHNPNTELFAQGVANVFSPLVGGLPATGAIARTATSIRSGAKTPVAGMLHAVTLLLVLLVAAPLAERIPLCVLAAILMIVSYNMGEWSEIPEILKLSRANIVVWAITFGLTVFADLTVAVEVGMILAALLYIRKVTHTTVIDRVTTDYIRRGFDHSLQIHPLPEGVDVFQIHGPFLFGSADKLEIITDNIDVLAPIVVLRFRHVNALDETGLFALENLAEKLHQSGRILLFCGMRHQPAELMQRAEFHKVIGEKNFVPSLRHAIERIREIQGTSSPETVSPA